MNALWLRIRPFLSTFVRYMHISYLEAKSEYEGTVLGILWIPISTILFAALLGLVFHFGEERTRAEFFLYVLSGYVCWNFISDSISRSTDIVQKRFEFAIHNNLSLPGLYGKMLADRVFEFGTELVFLVAICALFYIFGLYGGVGWPILMLAPLLALLAATSLAASYLVNLVTVLVPDLGNVIKTAVRLMFFATPVFWEAEGRTDFRGILEVYNPASYYLMMMRQVFGVDPFSWDAWIVGATITIVVSIAGLATYRWSRGFVRNLR